MRRILFLSALLLAAGCGTDTSGSSSSDPGDTSSGDIVETDTTEEPDTDVGDDDTEPGCVDSDGDGFGPGCDLGEDCEPDDADVFPGADEICHDGVDNNCDGVIDEDCGCLTGQVVGCYDGPVGTAGQAHCQAGFRVCTDGMYGDCVGQALPNTEICDGIDNDCDGGIDNGVANACGGCGELPLEQCGDWIDNNCDGVIDEGCDCDSRTNQPCYAGPPGTSGVGTCHGGTTSCGDDGTWSACVGQVIPEFEVCDGIDNDCDGFVDEGVTNSCGTCGDVGVEICDGIDNNCDGIVDEGLRLPCGACADDIPEEDICGDGFDNDCNGVVDDGCACLGDPACYTGPPEMMNVGACTAGTRTCEGAGEYWGTCIGSVYPTPEVCDSIDNDCDGLVDISPDGCSVCGSDPEICDGIDNDCDGAIDEGLLNACGQCIADVSPEEWMGPEGCDGEDNDCDGMTDEGLVNACGTCGESCYVEVTTPSLDDFIDEGAILIDAGDPDNPTGRPGLTLAASSFIPPFLWAANHEFDTATRFNTETHQEEGRYWVGDNVSRTAVDLDGNVWTAGRNDGRVTKILWDITTCPDRNGNGVIDTSRPGALGPLNSAADPLADECVVFSSVVMPSQPSIRGVATGPDGRVWVGFSAGTGGVMSIDPHTFELSPHYPSTGIPHFTADETGTIRPVMSGDTQTTTDAGLVYGLIVDSDGYLYMSGYNRTQLARFDTNTNTWDGVYRGYSCGSYGIAVDGQNRIWTGGYNGCRGIGMLDPETMRFHNFIVPNDHTMAPGSTTTVYSGPGAGCGSPNYCVTGVGAEPATGDIWASFYAQGYTGRLHVNEEDYAASTWEFIGTTRDAAGSFLPGVGPDLRGVGFDAHGNAWTLGLGSGSVWMIDPTTNERHTDLPAGAPLGQGSHYTYSDFTGSTALSFTAPRSLWRYVYDAGYTNALLDGIMWESYVPEGTTAGIRVRVLDAGTPLTGWYPAEVGGAPTYDMYPPISDSHYFDTNSLGLSGPQFEVEVRLTTDDIEVRPIVHELQLYWQRP